MVGHPKHNEDEHEDYSLLAPQISYVKSLLDSGARREFETGAVRDISNGKGRCDLLPLGVIGKHFIIGGVLDEIDSFKRFKRVGDLKNALNKFKELYYPDLFTMLLEVSIHFEQGAAKYSENNWMKGMPLHCYIDSAVRHYLKHLRGDTDEPHDRAFVWNILCAIWTFENKPELDDINIDITEKA